jgi:PLP dependent protein
VSLPPDAADGSDGAARPGDGGIAVRLAAVRGRLARAAEAAGRAPEEVRLVAVTKTHPVEAARRLLELGVADLGENRVDELLAKQEVLRSARWHLVGRLQSNKARAVVGRVALIHSVDRRSLAEELSRRAVTAEVEQAVLVQVNIGDDPAKGGCDLGEAAALVAYASSLPGLRVEGLMTVPPLPPPGVPAGPAARPLFAALRHLRDQVVGSVPTAAELSMGMSDDLEAAVAEGATMVRIGTAILGGRMPAGRREETNG